MPHDVSLIAAVAAAFGLALALGLAAQRLGIPPLVGYLVAGILIGPATPGYVADLHLTQQLAELGVMLMMFGVGLPAGVRMTAYIVSGILIVAACGLMLRDDPATPSARESRTTTSDGP